MLELPDLTINENPEYWDKESKQGYNSEPRQVVFSEWFESEEIIIYWEVKPRLFHCPVSPIFLMEILEWFCYFWVYDIVLWEAVSIWLYLLSCRELAWLVGWISSFLGDIERVILGQSSFVPTEIVNIHFIPDYLISK